MNFNAMEHMGDFKCSFCQYSLKEPIMLVPNFGDVCGTCYSKQYQSKGWKGIPNVTLEKTLRQIMTTCKFRPKGCTKIGNYNDLFEHQEHCEYMPVRCPISYSCGYPLSSKELAYHFISKHANNVITKYRNWFQFPIVGTEGEIFKLLFGSSESCFLQMRKDKNNIMLISAYGGSQSDYDNVLDIEFRGKISKELECKILPLNDFGKSVEFSKINFEELKMDLIFVVIKYRKAEIDKTTLKNYECSFCYNLMSGIIMECQNGHSFCENCWKKISKCSVCSITKEDCGYCRNKYLEGLIQEIPYVCKNRQYGCLETFPLKSEATVHETCCSFKLSTCPVKNCGIEDNFLDILTHFKLKHKFNHLKSRNSFKFHNTVLEINELVKTPGSSIKDFVVDEYLMDNNNIFLLTVKYMEGKLTSNVAHLLKGDSNVNFGYKIRLTSATDLNFSVAKTNQCNRPVHFQWSDLQLNKCKNYLLELYCEIGSNIQLLDNSRE